MPLIVRAEAYARWLDPSIGEPGKIADVLSPYVAEEMVAYPIINSRIVNNVKNEGPQLIEPVG